MSKGFLKKYLSEADLAGIAAKIGEVEKTTSGEIRVCIRHRRHWRERKMSLHELAVHEFHRLKMHHTKERTGILIMLLFNERKFHIVADEGIHRKVEDGTWDRVAEGIAAHFKKGNFFQGICDGLESVGTVLSRHFPRQKGGENELPNKVEVD